MAKTLAARNLSALINQGVAQGKDLWEQVIPDKKLLRKYEALLEQKLSDLKDSAKLEELVKPIRQKLEKSCMKPLEAKNLQEFSQRVVHVLRVQAKKQKKAIEKRLGKKLPVARKSKKRATRAKRATA